MANSGRCTGESNRLSCQQFVAAVEAAPVGIVITDPHRPDNPVTYVNAEFSAITGWSADEVLGHALKLLEGPGTDPAAMEEVGAALRDGRVTEVGLLNYRKSGDPFWVRVQIRPVFGADGRLDHVIGSLSDMTAVWNAEKSTRESEARLRALTEALPLPVLHARMDGTIIEGNVHAHEILRVPAAGLIGRNVHEFNVDGDEATERLCNELQTLGTARRAEIRARRLDGSPIWLLASGQTLSFEGETSQLIIFQDLTELRRREQNLTEANEQADRTIRARMRFLAAASHDLRQPLQALALFSSALDKHVTTPQGRTIVQSMKTCLRGMEEMFDSLLDMSRLDAGVMKAVPQVFLLNDILERLESAFQPQAEAAGLDLRFVPSSAAVRSDPGMLTRIVGNFLSNAIRYTRQGRILVGCRFSGTTLKVMVCDSGPGIPASQRLEIFKEFRQGEAQAVQGRGAGIGLGLAIVQRLARLLNHRLDVRSVEGHGTCFSVEVPLAEEWLPGAPQEAEAPEQRPVAGATVIVIDDDPDVQSGLKMLLEAWGCRSIIADSADGALAELAASGARPDLILADLHLRESSDGIAAIKRIRERTGLGAPAVLFTGDTEVGPELGTAEGYPVLRKPIDPMHLRTVLANALGV
jgi:PAS domain S-box-containing protein